MDRLGVQEGEVIQHGMVTKAIERAQKRVEAQNFAIRKHLLEYDNVMNQQREVIYDRRLAALEGADLKEEVLELIEKTVENKVEQFTGPDEYTENWNLVGLREELRRIFLLELKFKDEDIPKLTKAELKQRVTSVVKEIYENKEKAYGADIMRQLERFAMLQAIDEMWKEHLYELDMLKTGIGLRAYGQKDPLLEYKKEAFQMFAEMVDKVDEEALSLMYKLQLRGKEEPAKRKEPEKRLQAIHQEAVGMGYSTTNQAEEVAPGKPKPVKVGQKVGRNDPCPCGSGKKYKKCCGA
jgi:preprotein translocase subunit SecA